MLKPGTEIVVIIAQFPHILPVQFQWPNNVLASSAQATEHNGEPQKCCNEEGGSRVSLELLRVGAAGPPAAPEVGLRGAELPAPPAFLQLHKGFGVPSPKEGSAGAL